MPRRLSLPLLFVLALFLYRAPSPVASGIIDTDYYWHLMYGEWILDHGALPTADAWSWPFLGHPYKLTQWLGEVVMALAQRAAGGELGTQVLSAGLVAATIGLSYVAARAHLDNRVAALAVACLCDAVLVSLPCRPHQFTHLGLAALTALVAHYQVRRDRRLLYAIPPLLALWVNLHGGYAVGLAYLWMMTAFLAAEAYMTRQPDLLRRTVAPLAIAAGAATLATLANPYGPGAWRYAIDIAQLKSSSAGIVDEWNPTNIKMDAGLQWYVASTAMFAALAASTRRPRLAELLSAVALVAAGWSALRVSLMMGILLVPLTAGALRHSGLYTLAFDGEARRHDRDVALLPAVLALAALLAVAIGMGRIDRTASKYVEEHLPQREVAFMRAHGLRGRLLNSPESGGYLIRHLGQPVFLDTRLDLYGDRALFEYLFARRGEAGWKDYLARLDPDILLLDNLAALRQLATDAGLYRMVFEGPRYSILVRAGTYPELPTVGPADPLRDILRHLTS